jgi:hypothetical protein
MSAIDPNSRGTKLLELQILAKNRNFSVEDGYWWFVDESSLTLVKRKIGQTSVFWKETTPVYRESQNVDTNPIVEKVNPFQSANTFDSQSPYLWFVVALVVFVLFKVSANQ